MGPSDFWLLTISSPQGEPPTVGFTDLLNEEKVQDVLLEIRLQKTGLPSWVLFGFLALGNPAPMS